MSDNTDREFARILLDDQHHAIEERLKENEGTFTCPAGVITMTELEWMRLFVQVATHFKWATSVTCWPELEALLSQFVGWEDENHDEFFTEFVSKTEAWAAPGRTVWSPTILAANVLSELGFFEGPEQMVNWMVNAVTATSELEAQANGTDDEED